MKIKKLMLIFLMLFCLFLTGCSSFFGEEEINQIVNIEVSSDNKTLIIHYTDGTKKEVNVPEGQQGLTGNGIRDIEVKESEDKTHNIVTIYFSDSNMDEEVFKVDHGVSVVDIEETLSDDGVKSFKLVYSNGTKSESITIPKGDDGIGFIDSNGDGMVDYTSIQDADGNTYVTLFISDGSTIDLFLPAAKGEDGVGIDYIESSNTSTHYVLIIHYTDPNREPQIVEFLKPETPNTWHNGEGSPSSGLGISGDFYFDTLNDIIYRKVEFTWTEVVNLGKFEEKSLVIFDFCMEGVQPENFSITKGSNFASSGYSIPFPERDGYEFVGWYTTKNPNVTNGVFTDMTVVTSTELKLYAVWKQK